MNRVRHLPRLGASAALLGLLALGASACAADQAATVEAANDDGNEVVVDDMAYAPDTLTVPAGTTVTWTFEDGVAHDVVGDDFESDVLTDGSFSHTFDEPGTYEYFCSLHPNMTATIEVTP